MAIPFDSFQQKLTGGYYEILHSLHRLSKGCFLGVLSSREQLQSPWLSHRLPYRHCFGDHSQLDRLQQTFTVRANADDSSQNISSQREQFIVKCVVLISYRIL